MRVVICEPGKLARIAEVENSLEALQNIVGGDIEVYNLGTFDPSRRDVIICNEDGKIIGMEPCRGLRSLLGGITDIIYGTFLICGTNGEEFRSLSADYAMEYMSEYLFPEKFEYRGDQVHLIAYVPQEAIR